MKRLEKLELIIVQFVVVVEKKKQILKIISGAMTVMMYPYEIFIYKPFIEIDEFYNMIKMAI
jgi:hypothetical protein